MAAPVTVYPPDEDGGRRVRAADRILGRAHGPRDLFHLLEEAGWNPDDVALDGPLIQWRGGGPTVWQPTSGDL
ncbi:hypothetical protein HMPREF1486_03183 [Streptomyces sp. HPH0547]|uniref:hypothetical protein n=1 Tax=Streptomyces TaxID=1883 RepID=UPI00034E2426|nr:hypothetical protein [Streptomyces sp. HPH0547]EPD94630.1 hypothetical protein HMPREF1486_03183 [Streptomyces sp. HPH0547]